MGTAQIFSGSGISPSCGFTANPVGYPNGTPTGGVLFRCQMTEATQDALWLPSGAKPSDVGSTADPQPVVPDRPEQLPAPEELCAVHQWASSATCLAVLTYGPGLELFNLALQKEFRVRESQRLQFKVEATNALNHFNPSNPNMTLTRNYNTGVNTNAAFGTIQSAQYQSRRAILSVRYQF